MRRSSQSLPPPFVPLAWEAITARLPDNLGDDLFGALELGAAMLGSAAQSGADALRRGFVKKRPMTSRLLQIARVAAHHRLDALASADALAAGDIPRGVRWALRAWPGRWLPTPHRPPAVRLRLALEALGPVFIKFGQLLSTRRDMLPPDYAEELAKLQDHVPPFPGEEALALVEEALGADFRRGSDALTSSP